MQPPTAHLSRKRMRCVREPPPTSDRCRRFPSQPLIRSIPIRPCFPLWVRSSPVRAIRARSSTRWNTGLRELGQPVRERGLWRTALHARDRELTVIDKQDHAALAGDVPSLVASVRDSAIDSRHIAITATIFGTNRCVI